MQIVKRHFLIISILLLGAVLRLYRIGDYMTFLGDEGRDVLVVKHILEGDPTLLGPRASAGDFFLGPIYYYLMTPFLWLWGLDPVGPAIMVALFGVATIFLVYYMGKKFFSVQTSLIAAFLYAISPLVIVYSRSSWNPNVMPFFTLFTMIILYKGIVQQKINYFIVVGFLLGIIMQLHYLGTFVALIIALFTLIGSTLVIKKNWIVLIKQLVIRYAVIFIGFLIGFAPFLLFEIRNGFPNSQNIFKFIFNNTVEKEQIGAPYSEIVSDVFVRVFGRLLVNFPEPRHFELYDDTLLSVWTLGIIIFGAISIVLLLKMKDKVQMSMIFTWLFVGILAFGLYKKPIYDYYFGFLFPIPFLLVGNLITSLYSVKKGFLLSKGAAVLLFGVILIPNIYFAPVQYEPNRQKGQVQGISEFVLSQTGGKSFNFALITGGNSDHGYRYFFELNNRAPVTIENEIIDPERKTVTDQLLVICEQECLPEGDSLWEVAGFGRGKVVEKWDVSVVKVYKLIHYTEKE